MSQCLRLYKRCNTINLILEKTKSNHSHFFLVRQKIHLVRRKTKFEKTDAGGQKPPANFYSYLQYPVKGKGAIVTGFLDAPLF